MNGGMVGDGIGTFGERAPMSYGDGLRADVAKVDIGCRSHAEEQALTSVMTVICVRPGPANPDEPPDPG